MVIALYKPKFIVLDGQGWNCENETAEAIELAGGKADKVYIKKLMANPKMLRGYQGLVLPGGFTYGDDLGSGRVAALDLESAKYEMKKFLKEEKIMIGICNGFQIAVWLGITPAIDGKFFDGKKASLLWNDSAMFRNRWTYLKNVGGDCVLTKDIDTMYLPVRHGEGKFVASKDVLKKVEDQKLVAFRYCDENGNTYVGDPYNPNGSTNNIAACCTKTTLFMMPHPEAYTKKWQHPRWTREPNLPQEGDGMKIFRNAVDYFE